MVVFEHVGPRRANRPIEQPLVGAGSNDDAQIIALGQQRVDDLDRSRRMAEAMP
jgi:hypothetical protein